MASNGSSYVDYETFLKPDFSPAKYANTLVLATNNANDAQVDLATPLSRVLFDQQEVDTHIDTLTTTSALPLIQHTQERNEGGKRILDEVEGQVTVLKEAYQRLEKEVTARYEAAEEVQRVAERLVSTLRLGRSLSRALQLSRTLQTQAEEVNGGGSSKGKSSGDHRSMVPAATTLLGLRQLFASSGPGEEGEGLGRVQVVTTLRQDIVGPSERQLLAKAQQVVREFSMSSLLASTQSSAGTGAGGATYAQNEDTRARTTAALHTLYLLSPMKPTATITTFEPALLISALSSYLHTALTSSVAALARALATLPTLERTLLEISARCQNIVALEALLSATKAPTHPLLIANSADGQTVQSSNFLVPLLKHLDTSSLPSYFWRSMAGQLTAKVQDILNKGGVSARTLRTNRDRVKDSIRECVDRGSQLPSTAAGVIGKKEGRVGDWQREAAVMVGSVIGPLQR